MKRTNKLIWRKQRKYLFKNFIHLVFLTWHNGDVFTKEILQTLENLFAETCKEMKCELIKFHGEKNLVRLFLSVHPTVSISTLAGSLKGTSSRFVMREFSEELKDKLFEGHLWCSSYCTFSNEQDLLDNLEEFIKSL